MDERTPLKATDEEYVEEEEWSTCALYSLYSLGGAIGLSLLYLFVFYLPLVFVPPATELEGIVKITELQATLSPIAAESHGKRAVDRYILVGDIHGHYREFRKLLRKAQYNPKHDHLLVLGDFISKGPDSIKVLDYLIDNDVDCILGNHEWYVLQNYATFHGLDKPVFVGEPQSIEGDYFGGALIEGGFNDDPEYLLAKKLHPHHVHYINRCSVMKTLGQVPLHKPTNDGGVKHASGVAVHGGLRWDHTLEDQNPLECLEMRSLIGPFFNESSDDPHVPNAVSWSKVWNRKQKLLPTKEAQVVYYGHDARRGLNLKKFAKGLDSGCDRGDRLSAMVIWREGSRYQEHVVDVGC